MDGGILPLSPPTVKLFTWGFGIFGRLGHGDDMSRNVPTKIDHVVTFSRFSSIPFDLLTTALSSVIQFYPSLLRPLDTSILVAKRKLSLPSLRSS